MKAGKEEQAQRRQTENKLLNGRPELNHINNYIKC